MNNMKILIDVVQTFLCLFCLERDDVEVHASVCSFSRRRVIWCSCDSFVNPFFFRVTLVELANGLRSESSTLRS